VGIVLTILRDLMRFWQEYLVATAVWRGIMDIRCEIYDTVLDLPTTFFQAEGVSDTMSRFVADTPELARGMVTLFGKTLVEPAKAIAAIAVAMCISPQLTLLAMVAGPPAFYLIRVLGRFMRKASKRALESWSQLLGLLEETLNGIRVVKAYTMEDVEKRRFREVNARLVKQQRRMARVDAATAPGVEALGVTAAMVAMGVAGYWVLTHKYGMNPDRFVALIAALAAMFDPVRKLSKVATRFQRSDAAASRIFELMDRPREKAAEDGPDLSRHVERLELRDVTYRYPNAAEPALREVDLSIEAGQTVAIVGPNGCGKTTLVSLIPRLIEPSSGAVLLDGQDVSEHSMLSLRRQIGLVTQDSVLFHATVAENIAYGKPDATREEVLTASRQAFVDEFVSDAERMPEGYDTMVGEHGATLSGGQRQRICVARAILRDPAILIFDEAMSQVDADSERKIHRAMDAFMRGRTTLMIAHRFGTVLSADRIVVMNLGRIVDSGTNAELLERCELYRHLHRTQFGAPDGEETS
jgi:ABC-type multidrug transport system fused ATPase/permease subunit